MKEREKERGFKGCWKRDGRKGVADEGGGAFSKARQCPSRRLPSVVGLGFFEGFLLGVFVRGFLAAGLGEGDLHLAYGLVEVRWHFRIFDEHGGHLGPRAVADGRGAPGFGAVDLLLGEDGDADARDEARDGHDGALDERVVHHRHRGPRPPRLRTRQRGHDQALRTHRHQQQPERPHLSRKKRAVLSRNLVLRWRRLFLQPRCWLTRQGIR
mmetsp:Transcript_2965/g.9896  ORF Transcript_2965/g.9896 Transcript_2965/m.9896 type:complete len:212 (-) Transcript_2965:27-662(-)